MHYLDNAATTRVLPEAAEAAVHAMCEEFGNPSSLHRMGLEASHLLEDSRRTVASALGCRPRKYISPPAARRAPTSACAVPLTSTDIKRAASSRPRSSTRQPSTPQSSLLPDGFRRSFPCTGRNRSHHARGTERSIDRGPPFFYPASWSTTRSARYSRSNSSESCSRPRHPKRCSILMPYRVSAVYA